MKRNPGAVLLRADWESSARFAGMCLCTSQFMVCAIDLQLKASPAGEVWRADYKKHFPYGVLGAAPLPAFETELAFVSSESKNTRVIIFPPWEALRLAKRIYGFREGVSNRGRQRI
jgi:hypothetical protein